MASRNKRKINTSVVTKKSKLSEDSEDVSVKTNSLSEVSEKQKRNHKSKNSNGQEEQINSSTNPRRRHKNFENKKYTISLCTEQNTINEANMLQSTNKKQNSVKNKRKSSSKSDCISRVPVKKKQALEKLVSPKSQKKNSKISDSKTSESLSSINEFDKNENSIDDNINLPVLNQKDSLKIKECITKDDSSSDDSEWEEVPDQPVQDLDEYKPVLPVEGVDIILEGPVVNRHRRHKSVDVMDIVRMQINRIKKDIQIHLHKVHLLCLIAHGMFLNKLLSSEDFQALSLSILPVNFFDIVKKNSSLEINIITDFVEWFKKTFTVSETCSLPLSSVKNNLVSAFENLTASNASEYNLLFISLARCLGMKVRFCFSLYPITFKAQDLIKKKKEDIDSESSVSTSSTPAKNSLVKGNSKPEKIKSSKIKKEPKSVEKDSVTPVEKDSSVTHIRPSRIKKSVTYKASCNENDSSDDDFIPQKDNDKSLNKSKKSLKTTKTITNTKKEKVKVVKKNRKILSSDSELSDNESVPNKGVEVWAEVYSKSKERWISVECSHGVIDKPYDIKALATQPVSYVLAYDNKSHIKDVTKRYCSEWLTHTRKLRIDSDWWEETLESFLPPNDKFNREEDSQLELVLVTQPMPATIGEFKNHPLYALKRHLLKFEGIYPPDAPTVGFIRGEAVYARENIHTLHSRETWLKEARVVRIGEIPYKIVKARPKWDKIAGVIKTDLPLELFGFWQTEKYMPPIAQNGKVPRNEYGNVELFKPCMLPVGTVHLRIPYLNKVAKKLGIDCSPAVVGFDGHKGSVHPVFDGFIVCEEFKDTLLLACEEEERNVKKREEEKRLKRIYGNWKRLVKGILIREKIKRKYARD